MSGIINSQYWQAHKLIEEIIFIKSIEDSVIKLQLLEKWNEKVSQYNTRQQKTG